MGFFNRSRERKPRPERWQNPIDYAIPFAIFDVEKEFGDAWFEVFRIEMAGGMPVVRNALIGLYGSVVGGNQEVRQKEAERGSFERTPTQEAPFVFERQVGTSTGAKRAAVTLLVSFLASTRIEELPKHMHRPELNQECLEVFGSDEILAPILRKALLPRTPERGYLGDNRIAPIATHAIEACSGLPFDQNDALGPNDALSILVAAAGCAPIIKYGQSEWPIAWLQWYGGPVQS